MRIINTKKALRAVFGGLGKIKTCGLCGSSLPPKPDYIHTKDGFEIVICNECGDVYDAMNTVRTGDDSWLKQK